MSFLGTSLTDDSSDDDFVDVGDTGDVSSIDTSDISSLNPFNVSLPIAQTTLTVPGMSTAQTVGSSLVGAADVISSIGSVALSAAVLSKLPASQIAGISGTTITTTNAQTAASAATLAQQAQTSTSQKTMIYAVIAPFWVTEFSLSRFHIPYPFRKARKSPTTTISAITA